MTPFERIGEDALRAIVNDFVDAVFADAMIGFFFRAADRERIKRFEYEHAAAFLGAPVTYGGRALGQAHAAHRIMAGHFNRRKEILRQTLEHHRVPKDIADAWLDHTESLRSIIVRGDC